MKFLIFTVIFINISNCSLNKNSSYWKEDPIKDIKKDKNFLEILEKSKDIRLMTFEEYNIYIDEYTKRNKYPNLNK